MALAVAAGVGVLAGIGLVALKPYRLKRVVQFVDPQYKLFDRFDPEKVARYSAARIVKLLGNAGIIRNRLKIHAAVQNAKAFLKVREEFGSFDSYIWRFVDGKPIINDWKTMKAVPPRTPVSDAMSKDLKQRGFKFVGSTICYAHMQATGMVNDHLVSCFRHKQLC